MKSFNEWIQEANGPGRFQQGRISSSENLSPNWASEVKKAYDPFKIEKQVSFIQKSLTELKEIYEKMAYHDVWNKNYDSRMDAMKLRIDFSSSYNNLLIGIESAIGSRAVPTDGRIR